jgi:PAS domain S-box-containing protein
MQEGQASGRDAGGAAERYALLMECVTDYAILTLDPEGRITGWNAGGRRMFGYAEAEVVGRPFRLLFTAEDVRRGAPEAELAKAAAQGRAADDRWHARKDGSRLWVGGVTTALRDPTGVLRGFVKVCRDRTEPGPAGSEANVLLVDDLPANLLVLEAILDGLGYNLVWAGSGEEALRRLLDRDFAVVLLDVRMPGLNGFEAAQRIRGQARSRDVPIIFLTAHESDEFPIAEAYRLGAVDYLVKPLVPEILRAKVAGFVELFQKAEQIRRQAEELRQLERRELERKLAEEDARLRHSEERFARFMRHLPGLAWIKDGQGRYLFANEAALRAFRTTAADLYGKTDEEVFPPETAAQFRENDRQAVTGGSGVQAVEVLRHDDGVAHHSLVSKFPIPGPEGEPALVGGVAIDITDRLRAEEALREADRRKDEFLAMLGHELRNPLAPIRNAVHFMTTLAPADADLRRARDMIERQVRHMTRLVDDLLDVSRVTRGKITLHREPLLAADVVAAAAEAIRPLMEARGHRLTVSLPERPLRLEGDATRLAQVFDNLLSNAAKYQDPGGQIWLSADQEGEEVVFRIRDQGVGIAQEKLAEVFELFTQVDRTLDRAQGGLGIGLALVKRLVELHGGRTEAHSEGPGRGCEFVVRLPALVAPPAEGAAVAGQAGDRPSSPRRVLIVDDNADAAESLAMVLRLGGHDVRTAYEGPAALEVAAAFRPEVVFLDIGLPRMDGYEVGRRLRRQPGLEGTRLVAMTGYGQDEDRRKAREVGFDLFLTKPVDPLTLWEVVAGAN